MLLIYIRLNLNFVCLDLILACLDLNLVYLAYYVFEF